MTFCHPLSKLQADMIFCHPLSKSFSLLADSSHGIDLRRKNFKSELKEEYKPLFADSNPVTELLFGNDLGKDAKELTGQKKTVLVVLLKQPRYVAKHFITYYVRFSIP